MHQDTIIGHMQATPELTEVETHLATEEALDPEQSLDYVQVGPRLVHIKLIPLRHERFLNRILTPYVRFFDQTQTVENFEDLLETVLIEAESDKLALGAFIFRAYFGDEAMFQSKTGRVPDGKGGMTERAIDQLDVIAEWLLDNTHGLELSNLIKAQVKKNRLAESLGKLWRPSGPVARSPQSPSISPSPGEPPPPSTTEDLPSDSDSTP